MLTAAPSIVCPHATRPQAGRRRAKAYAGAATTYKKATWNSDRKPNQIGVDDMTLLTELSDAAINANLSKRFHKAEIYTYIGHVLISVNPFRDLGIYTDQSAYYRMKSYSDNQCVIISGESGAGKTEAAKKIMQYIAHVSGGSDSTSIQHVKDMVLATNPLLESFGNAKTLKNTNSSRFGKYLEIYFNARSEPVGAHITNYLLEKSRVTMQIQNERNFHIFYQICKSACDAYREFGISGPECYTYTSASNCLTVDGIDDAAEYADVLRAMQIIGITQQEQSDIHRLMAAILWLGNIEYAVNPDGNGEDAMLATSASQDALNSVAYLLQVDAGQLHNVLLHRVIVTPKPGGAFERFQSPLNVAQAQGVRDALAKGVYARLFDWIVERVNVAMKPTEPVAKSIGILDIYGFELFDKNSFEQLCMCNEMLQSAFINLTIKTEQEDYVAEGIQWTPIEFFDNRIVCELIEEKRPTPGVFAIMNDACARVHADPEKADQTLQSDLNRITHSRFFAQTGTFTIRHYAGDVTYTVSGMSEKNRDANNKDLLELIKTSKHALLLRLFPEDVDRENRQRPPTASDKIKQSAGDLFNTLMQCQPNYIRCIKPNQNRSPREFDDGMCLHQVKYLGLLQNVKVRRAGFASRQTFERFLERFYMLSSKTCYAGECTWNGPSSRGAGLILEHTGIPKEQWQLGKSKVFIKSPETLFKLEAMRDHYWHKMALRIQRAWHKYQERRNKCARIIQQAYRDYKGLNIYVQMRDYGHQVLKQKKERRRFSLVSMRRYLGDYLDVAGAGGAFLRTAAELSPDELIIFSARAQAVVFRFLRSSKLSPRMIVMTDKHFAMVVSKAENNQVVQRIDRKYPLRQIKGITLTPFQDDFVHLSVEADEDVLLACPFKTELVTYLVHQLKVPVQFSPDLVYTNKKEAKSHKVKSHKDDTSVLPGAWAFKKDKITVNSGAPATSVSNPPCKRKSRPAGHRAGTPTAAAVKPKPKPSPASSTATAVNAVKPKPMPAVSGTATTPAKFGGVPAMAATAAVASQPTSATITPSGSQSNLSGSNENLSSGNAARPTPPKRPAAPPRPVPAKPMYKLLYAFQGQDAGELSVEAGEQVEVVTKQDGGWWMAKNAQGKEGWVPESYLELIQAPVRPPPPPRPVARNTTPSPNPGAAANGQAQPVAAAAPVAAPLAAGADAGIPEWKRQLLAKLEQQKQQQAGGGGAPVPAARPAMPRR
ncbi:P-loop containing nucleoside triphosphate hydrolase protein [Catenaria anguillulae PL171]|uniref:p-loop containing nucleoside triphosphate hydrolase protein n=1 Tax=Catenaria anguillulae PL171 TaxID=765915 RepID=A0A1Y2HK46_9FUNG|nr:P-loop containing nucleoside triphosphate hydrolase protein [Catenaria anguillulae PL171]